MSQVVASSSTATRFALPDMSSNEQNTSNTSSDSEVAYDSMVYEDGDGYGDATGILPGTDDYPGPLNFQLYLNTEDTKTKRSWLYSLPLKKLYVDINKVVCVQFKLKQAISEKIQSSKDNLSVRALPVYAAPEFLQEPVTRCPVHVMTDKVDGEKNDQVPWLYHVLRAEHHEAVYHSNRKSKRHSVVVPLHTPTLGSEFITIMYKFTCKTSCAYGLNRRPVHVIFTLENGQGEILGRRKLLVKVCSCPKRDLQRDELVATEVDANGRKRKINQVENSTEIHSPPRKEIKMENAEEDKDEYENREYVLPSLHITGRHLYTSTLELLHSHFLGLSVRYDALLDMHPHISKMAELLDRVRNEGREPEPEQAVSTQIISDDGGPTTLILADETEAKYVVEDVGSTKLFLDETSTTNIVTYNLEIVQPDEIVEQSTEQP